MNKKDKELLLKDLCARLPYGVIVEDRNGTHTLNYGNTELYTEHIKPYLRPLSSMTKEEYEELKEISPYYGFAPFKYIYDWAPNYEMIDWLNAHHFDYRGLIEKGLAIEAPSDMYK